MTTRVLVCRGCCCGTERKHPETGAAEVYLVFPVSYAKQADVNNRYWSALATFSKAVNAELAQRSVSQLFGM